jgi:hypothetical protein
MITKVLSPTSSKKIKHDIKYLLALLESGSKFNETSNIENDFKDNIETQCSVLKAMLEEANFDNRLIKDKLNNILTLL